MAHSLYLLFFTGIFKCFINDPFNQLLFNVNVETQHTYVGKAGKIVGFCFVGHFGKISCELRKRRTTSLVRLFVNSFSIAKISL